MISSDIANKETLYWISLRENVLGGSVLHLYGKKYEITSDSKF
jgi:hypothetical protein